MTNKKPIGRKSGIVTQDFGRELLIYDLKIHQAFCLNETSAIVWTVCDGKHSIGEITDILSQKLKTKASEDIVWLTLNELQNSNLLENEVENKFVGLSRREIIRKVGFASMIALPIISTLVAPTALHAQSAACACGAAAGTNSRMEGCSCATDSDCCGTCSGGTCTAPSILSAPTAAVCCPIPAGTCGCAAPSGTNARLAGCACSTDSDCCGGCSGGICTPPNILSAPSAAACCPAP
jgi:hypothetical protein